MDKKLKPLRSHKDKSYFIKIPNNPESAIFLKVLRQHFKGPKYRIRVFPNGYGGTLKESRAWRIYIQGIHHKTDSRGKLYYQHENLDIENIPALQEELFFLSKRTSEEELDAIYWIKKHYPEILMEYKMSI